MIGSRDISSGEAALKTIQALPNLKWTVETVQIDVTDDKSVDEATALVEKFHGRLDTMVKNARINRQGTPRKVARDIFETNVVGCISVAEAFLPLMQRSAAAGYTPRLIFVSSSTGSST